MVGLNPNLDECAGRVEYLSKNTSDKPIPLSKLANVHAQRPPSGAQPHTTCTPGCPFNRQNPREMPDHSPSRFGGTPPPTRDFLVTVATTAPSGEACPAAAG